MSIGRITDKGYATNAFLWENMSAICFKRHSYKSIFSLSKNGPTLWFIYEVELILDSFSISYKTIFHEIEHKNAKSHWLENNKWMLFSTLFL
jgi:hypothetical protein